MAIDFSAEPKKIKMSTKALDDAVQSYIDESSFKIQIGENKAVTYRTLRTPLIVSAYLETAKEQCMKEEGGLAVVDVPALAVWTHLFMMIQLSNLTPPATNDGDIDMVRVSAYGTYFLVVSEEYRTLFESLYNGALGALTDLASRYDAIAASMAKNMDMSKLFGGADIASTVADIYKNLQGAVGDAL